MNLFSRLSEILNIDMAEPIEEWSDLEKLFAENERQMERDLTDVKRHAAAVVALERRLARELKRHRAQAALWDDYAAAVVHRQRAETILKSLATRVADVRRRQWSILAWLDCKRRGTSLNADYRMFRRRLRRLVKELILFRANREPS